MKTTQILISGFGGQGVLFAGKFLAYISLLEGKQISWLPSYGPEMRGGTANCSVIVSDTPIGSPIVTHPDILIAMNLPSLDRYEKQAQPGSMIFYDSSLIEREVVRTDVKAFALPATKAAAKMGVSTLANMILVGKVIKETGVVDFENAEAALRKLVPPKRAAMIESNLTALKAGYEGL